MTVKELMEILKNVDSNLMIVIKSTEEGVYYTYDELSKEDIKVDSEKFTIYAD